MLLSHPLPSLLPLPLLSQRLQQHLDVGRAEDAAELGQVLQVEHVVLGVDRAPSEGAGVRGGRREARRRLEAREQGGA